VAAENRFNFVGFFPPLKITLFWMAHPFAIENRAIFDGPVLSHQKYSLYAWNFFFSSFFFLTIAGLMDAALPCLRLVSRLAPEPPVPTSASTRP
jgi:hypothetical protein